MFFACILAVRQDLTRLPFAIRVAAIRLPHILLEHFEFNRPAPLPPFPLYPEGPMPRRTIRLTEAIDARIESAAKVQGYSTPSAFLRAAIKKALNERSEGIGPSWNRWQEISGKCGRTCAAWSEHNRRYSLSWTAWRRSSYLCARAPWHSHGDRTRRGSKPPRPAAHECGTSDAQ